VNDVIGAHLKIVNPTSPYQIFSYMFFPRRIDNNVIDAMYDAFIGQPFMPSALTA
jgi:hypothetical protein